MLIGYFVLICNGGASILIGYFILNGYFILIGYSAVPVVARI